MRKFSSGLENVPPRTWAALFAAAVAAKSFYIKDYYPLTSTLNSFSDAGWRLIYGFGDFLVSYMMPFLTVISAAASEHRILAFFIAALSYFTLAFLCLNMGRLCSNTAAGVLAAAAVFFTDLKNMEQTVYAALVFSAFGFAARRAWEKTTAATAFAGLAVGVSLLVRSPLFLFPAVLAVYDWFSRRSFREYLKETALLFFCAYVLLLPWARLNWALHHKIILFERERAYSNVVAGALGSAQTIEGDFRAAAGISPSENLPLWAARETISHPGRYVIAAKRIQLVFSWHKILFLLAALGFYLRRKEPAARVFALGIGYFVLIHCLPAVEERYAEPLKMLLLPFAALAVAAPFSDGEGRKLDFSRAAAGLWLFWLAAALLVLWPVIRYPARMKLPLEAVRTNSGNWWLLRERGRLFLEAGRTEEGLEAMEKAFSASPASDPGLGYMLYAVSADGANIRPPQDWEWPAILGFAAKSFREYETGHKRESLKSFSEAREIWTRHLCRVRGSGENEEKIREILRNKDAGFFTTQVLRAAVFFKKEKWAGYFLFLERSGALLPPEVSAMREEILPKAVSATARKNSLPSVKKVSPPPAIPEPPGLRAQALALQNAGDCMAATKILGRLSADNPSDAEILSDLAVAEYLCGGAKKAEADFKKAVSLEPDYLPAWLSLASLYESWGEKEKALETCRLALEKNSARLRDPVYAEILKLEKKLEDEKNR